MLKLKSIAGRKRNLAKVNASDKVNANDCLLRKAHAEGAINFVYRSRYGLGINNANWAVEKVFNIAQKSGQYTQRWRVNETTSGYATMEAHAWETIQLRETEVAR